MKRSARTWSAVIGAILTINFALPLAAMNVYLPIATSIAHAAHAIDVGPGVEGLDYDKAVAWQQNVDNGKELWRLDPMQVARIQGRDYGFNDADTYTVTRQLDHSTLARHGEIDITINHDGQTYTMVLVRPIGGDSGSIWMVYGVTKADGTPAGGTEPAPPTTGNELVLFGTDQYDDWAWHLSRYPSDLRTGVLVGTNTSMYRDTVPTFLLDRVQNVDYSQNLVLFAYLGQVTNGQNIGIEKVTMENNNITVRVHTKSPEPGQMISQVIVYPFDSVTIDRSMLNGWNTVNVSFVDQNGRVLGTNRLIIHRS